MAGKTFDFKGDFGKLKRFYNSIPKMIERSGLSLTNDIAFKLRPEMVRQINDSMTVRSPGFVRGSLRIKKATFKDRVAEVGSIRRDRFTGWEEQETGKPDKRDRRQTTTARRGSWKHRVAPRFRFKSGKKKFVRPSDFGLRDNVTSNDIVVFLHMLARRKHRQPFYIPVKYKKLKRGVYIFRAKKIRTLHILDAKPDKIKQNKWMTRSIKIIDQAFVEKRWKENFGFLLNKSKHLTRVK